jgi:hypothetical protein
MPITSVNMPYQNYTINGVQVKELSVTSRNGGEVAVVCHEVNVRHKDSKLPPVKRIQNVRETEAYKTIEEQNNILENRLNHMGRDLKALIQKAKQTGKMGEEDMLELIDRYSVRPKNSVKNRYAK